jgi:D-glycero-D-manno-heptose 1,7-bisphosphate phosphatase
VTARPTVFLDRDGTLNEDIGYLHRWADFRFTVGALDGLRLLADYQLIVLTNQSGIARGMYTVDDLNLLHRALDAELGRQGIVIAAYYHCPHHPDFTGPCECRKPGLAMFEQACREHPVDVARSWLIGDQPDDLELARRAGLRAIQITGDVTLLDAAKQIVNAGR